MCNNILVVKVCVILCHDTAMNDLHKYITETVFIIGGVHASSSKVFG